MNLNKYFSSTNSDNIFQTSIIFAMNSLAIITSSGRRVSMLCDDDAAYDDYSLSYFSSNPASPMPPFSLSRPSVCDRSDSFCSTTSYNSASLSPLTPSSPTFQGYSSSEADQFAKSFNAMNFAIAKSMPSAQEEDEPSTPPTTSSDDLVVKKAVRKYTCKDCNKFFTTSGHLARHSRIHTGEKNYPCSYPGCAARFSRQDNCMQHYRTHTSGSGSKRSNRKKRTMSPEIVTLSDSLQPCYSSKYPSYSIMENGLDALANVASSAYV